MAAKIVLILALIAISRANPVNFNGILRQTRGIATSKATINDDLGRYTGFNDAKAEARAENSGNVQDADNKANAVAEINPGLNYFNLRTLDPVVAYEIPENKNDLSILGPHHAESVARADGESASSSAKVSNDLPVVLLKALPVQNTYFLKNTAQKGASWHFGTLYDIPSEVGLAHVVPEGLRYYDVYNGFGRLAPANQALAQSSVDGSNAGVAKSSVDINGAAQGSAEANVNVDNASTKSIENIQGTPTAKSTANISGNNNVQANADVTGHGSAQAVANTNSIGSPALVRYIEDKLENTFVNAKADVEDNVGSAKSSAVIGEHGTANAESAINGNGYGSAKSTVDASGLAQASAHVDGTNSFGLYRDLAGPKIADAVAEVNPSLNGAAKAIANVNDYRTGSLKTIANTNGFGTAKSSATSNTLGSSSESKADVDGLGHSSASSSVNSNEQGYYRFYDNRGFWRSASPAVTTNAQVTGQGSASSYANTQDALNLYRAAFFEPNAGQATAEARVQA